MILQIRGTSGSGKTTLMKYLMELYECKPHEWTANKRKVLVYKGRVPGEDRAVYVFGDYNPERSAGGCDTIPKIDIVIGLLKRYARDPDAIVIFEGLLLAHSWGAMGEFAHEKYGARYINAFLDTPEDLCLERVIQRRAGKGRETEGDRLEKIEHNVRADYHRVDLCWKRVDARGGVRVKIPHKKPKKFTVALIDEWISEHEDEEQGR